MISLVNNAVYTFSVADFGFTDPNDSPTNALAAVRITTVPAGTARITNNGVTVTAGTEIPIADILANLVQFVADANNRSFTFQVRDDGGTALGGVDLDQSTNTFTVNTPINNAPVLHRQWPPRSRLSPRIRRPTLDKPSPPS